MFHQIRETKASLAKTAKRLFSRFRLRTRIKRPKRAHKFRDKQLSRYVEYAAVYEAGSLRFGTAIDRLRTVKAVMSVVFGVAGLGPLS